MSQDTTQRRAAAAAVVRRRFAGPRSFWCGVTIGGRAEVTSRAAGDVPTSSRDGWRYSLIVGPFNTRRKAQAAREHYDRTREMQTP